MTLFEAVEREDAAEVKAALAVAGDVNELGPERRTPLIEAAGRGLLEIVELLLAAGAEPDWRDASDETALLRAAANGHLEVAQRLAPLSDDAERAMARAFLDAAGKLNGPEGLPGPEGGLKRKAIGLAARAAAFVGEESPQERLDRLARAEKNARKK